MLHACVTRFDVTMNLENFWKLNQLETKPDLHREIENYALFSFQKFSRFPVTSNL